ncbi:MAG: hypothetical protein L0154_22475 [Chloroflexi bacterium]|nr:hypothetical protein [Chloroflexota bacterium]
MSLRTLYPEGDTQTLSALIDAYRSAYYDLYGREANVTYLEGDWILVNGIMRERRWIIEETSRLKYVARQRKPAAELPETRSTIMRLIRRLSGL